MNNINDISSLESYSNFKDAQENLTRYRQKKQQIERRIEQRFQEYKGKVNEAEASNSFKESQEMQQEAETLKQQAEQAQNNLNEFQEKTPHYGNLRGEAMRELKAEGEPFISSLKLQARTAIDEAVDALKAVNKSREKFEPGTISWIPSVNTELNELQSVKERLK